MALQTVFRNVDVIGHHCSKFQCSTVYTRQNKQPQCIMGTLLVSIWIWYLHQLCLQTR